MPYKALSLMGKLQEGQASCLTEETVMAFLDIPVETFEIGAILHHGSSFDLDIDFLARLQVTVVA